MNTFGAGNYIARFFLSGLSGPEDIQCLFDLGQNDGRYERKDESNRAEEAHHFYVTIEETPPPWREV